METKLFDIKNEIENVWSKPLTEDEVFQTIIDNIHEVDFCARAYSELIGLRKKITTLNNNSNDYKAIQKRIQKCENSVHERHYLICAIEVLQETVNDKDLGLCFINDTIYIYNNIYWQKVNNANFNRFLINIALKMKVPEYTAKHFLFVEKLFKQFCLMAKSPPQINDNNIYMNVKNGVLKVKPNGKYRLVNHSKKFFLTYVLNYNYNPDSTCPMYNKYFNMVLPEKQAQLFAFEFIASALIKNGTKIKPEAFLILIGGGENGKSVFIDIVNAFFGKENILHYNLSQLTDDKGFYRSEFENKLMNTCTENSPDLKCEMLKTLASGEPAPAREIYKKPRVIEQYGKMMFSCNIMPTTVEQSAGFIRRFKVLPFNVTIPKKEQNQGLALQIIETEMSGFLNLVLAGLQRLINQGGHFSKSKLMEDAITTFRTESSSVLSYVDEMGLEKSKYGTIFLNDLYNDYRGFCSDNGYKPYGKINFSKHLESIGFIKRRDRKAILFYCQYSGAFSDKNDSEFENTEKNRF